MQTGPVRQKTSRIIGWGVVGQGESKRRMEATLQEFKRLCDDAILCVNSSDPDDIALIEKYVFPYEIDGREWGKAQHRIKEDFYKTHVAKMKPDWVVALDMDEVFDGEMSREDLERLADKGGIGYHFYVTNLYDEGYAPNWSFWNVRFYKYDPRYTKWEQKALHPGLAPKVVYDLANYAPYLLLHSGLKDKADRDRKAARYNRYDPHGKYKGQAYYDFLSSNYKPRPFDQKALQKAVQDEVKSIVYFKTEKDLMAERSNEYKYVRYEDPFDHTSHIVPIPIEDLGDTLSHPGYTVVSDATVKVVGKKVTSTVAEPPKAEPKDNVCQMCGFEAKNAFGLRSHLKKHD